MDMDKLGDLLLKNDNLLRDKQRYK